MSRRQPFLALVAALAASGQATADGLGVGDPAPKLEAKEFIKGAPVKGFEPDKVYVIDFWATWCGTCRTSIPHLTEIQKKYKDVVVIGVDVFEPDPGKVASFVKEMGERMDYRIALDELEYAKEMNGKSARAWMKAAGQDGMPTTFVVDGTGKIAWIGRPLDVEKPLGEIVAGKWDMAKAAAAFKAEAARKAAIHTLVRRLDGALADKNYRAIVDIVDEAIKGDPSLEAKLGVLKFEALVKLADIDRTLEYGGYLVQRVYAEQVLQLNNIAWAIVESPGDKPDPRLIKFAVGVAAAADKLCGGKDGVVADTLAKAHYEAGDPATALGIQERAVAHIKGTEHEKDKEFLNRLELYRKKVGK